MASQPAPHNVPPPEIMVNKGSIRPYFWGGWLTSHKTWTINESMYFLLKYPRHSNCFLSLDRSPHTNHPEKKPGKRSKQRWWGSTLLESLEFTVKSLMFCLDFLCIPVYPIPTSWGVAPVSTANFRQVGNFRLTIWETFKTSVCPF